MAGAAAAAVTLLRLPLARLSYHLRSVPSPCLSPPRLRISTSHRFLSSLGHGSASAAVAEAVAAPDSEGDLDDAAEESYEEESKAEAEAEAPRLFVLPRLPRPKLSVKERKELASYAHGLGKKLKSQQVGKGGVTPNLASAFSDNLESNELLKNAINTMTVFDLWNSNDTGDLHAFTCFTSMGTLVNHDTMLLNKERIQF